MSHQGLFMGDREVEAEQQTQPLCGFLEKLIAVPHTHAQAANIEQHKRWGENGLRHTEAGAEKQPERQTELANLVYMWQD
ncbi:MAG: hypothetical protein M1490_00970 [Candidatus Bathyarchaeota archaeon]|nr:hypothetical protein [Candidatus Bathyarchaeota archaeon]